MVYPEDARDTTDHRLPRSPISDLLPAVNLSKFELAVAGDHVRGLIQPEVQSPWEGEGEPGDLGYVRL